MKRILFIALPIIFCILSAAALAAGEIGVYVDFEKYPVGQIEKSILYKDFDLWADEDNLYIEGNETNKFLRVAHYSPAGSQSANIVSKYNLNLTEEVIFKFDIQNRNSDTGFVYVQLRANDGISPETGKNLFYPLEIKDNKITYLGDFKESKLTEEISDDEIASIVIFLNPETGEISVWNNGELKAHAEPNDKFKDFDFTKTIIRFQNYVKTTPVGQTPYITDITYDNITVIHGGNELFNISTDVFYNTTKINELKNGPINVKTSVINKSETQKKLKLFVTHKSGGQLINLGIGEASIGYGDVAKLTAPINISGVKQGDYMEIMLLDADTLKPVIAPKLVYPKNIIETPIADEMQAIYAAKKTAHPRVTAVSSDFARVLSLSKTDNTAKLWADKIIAEADRIVSADISDSSLNDYFLSYSDSMLGTSRNALKMVQTLGLAHKLSGLTESKYSAKAALILETVSAYPDWNTSHFLDTAEMMTALAFGYDWLFDALPDETKTVIENAVYQKGLLAADEAYKGTNLLNTGWWKDVDYNWNIVCNGAIAVTASAFADVYPELCFDLSAKAVNYVKYALKPFAPHGGAEEGCVYGIYTLRYLSKLHTTLLNTYGTDFGMMQHSGLSGLGDYLIQVDGSTGINSYHDTNGGNSHIDTSTLLWLGRVYNNPKFTAARLKNIENYNLPVTPFDLIWYNPDITSSDFTGIPLNSYFAGTELISMRSGFSQNDIYLSAHGGKANVSHSHIDGGTFVLDMLGFRVAADIGADSYDADGYFGDKRYEYYRTRAEGHNTLVINPDTTPGQSTACELKFSKSSLDTSSPFAILDMTDAYKPYNCTSAMRGYMLTDDLKSAVIRDELILNGINGVYWFMQTTADVSVSDNVLTLTGANGEVVKAEFITDADTFSLTFDDAVPLAESNSSVINYPNTLYKRVQFKVTAEDNVSITVKFTPQSGEFSDISNIKSLSQW